MNITIEIKSVYGRECIYPVCDAAKQFAALTGKITLSRQNLDAIKKMGYEVRVKEQTL